MGPSPRDQYAVPVVLREPPRRRRSLRLLRRRACDHAARLHRAEIAGEAMPLRYGNDRRCCERRGWRRGTESSQTHRWRKADSNTRSLSSQASYLLPRWGNRPDPFCTATANADRGRIGFLPALSRSPPTFRPLAPRRARHSLGNKAPAGSPWALPSHTESTNPTSPTAGNVVICSPRHRGRAGPNP